MSKLVTVPGVFKTTKVPVIELVPVNEIKAAPFNPKSRTDKRALSALKASIEKSGEVIVPLIITEDNWLADGHRRFACAKELGFLTVPCIRKTDVKLAALWGRLNIGVMAPNSRTWMEAIGGGYDIEFLPDKERGRVERLKRILTPEEFKSLVRAGRSSYILVMAETVGRYVGNAQDAFLRAIIIWFEKTQQQFAVRRAMADHCSPDVILGAITKQKALRLQWLTEDKA